MGTITCINGTEVDFDAAVNLMDDEIREELHEEGFYSELSFYEAYCERHLSKFNSEFIIN